MDLKKKEKKEFCNTIGKKGNFYEEHYFNIVHPKLDDPSEHYDLGRDKNKVTIKSKTIKEQKSIAMLKLDEEPHTTERGKTLISHFYELSADAQLLFDQFCNNNGIN